MPIENERKYVLPADFDSTRVAGWTRHDIRQAYLDDGPRIRQKNALCLFTYKRWIPEVKELVEIETTISQDDFNLLWPHCIQSIAKTRFEKQVGAAEWVVDFLYRPDGSTYFVLAEVELPRGQMQPDSIPDEIGGHIVHAVDAEDNRFTNKKLADPAYALKRYAELVSDVVE